MKKEPSVLIIDCFDSFTNLLQDLVFRAGGNPSIVQYTHDLLLSTSTHLILGPGPGSPHDYPALQRLITTASIPILGVCLGHQAAACAFGGRVRCALEPMHGKTSLITLHEQSKIFKGVPQQFTVGRYHSLVVERDLLPECLEVLATSEDGEIQAVQHKNRPYYGVQFHPESFLTEWGLEIMKNFLFGE